jgi:putative DNA primase/helicase
MRINSVFPSKYVKAPDLEGKPALWTMSHIEMETMGFGEDKKTLPVLYFKDVDRGLVLNRTNANTMRKPMVTSPMTGQGSLSCSCLRRSSTPASLPRASACDCPRQAIRLRPSCPLRTISTTLFHFDGAVVNMSNCFETTRYVDVRGRWASVLASLGMPSKFLSGKNCPCPICGGKDRFRFLDTNGDGTFICNQCGTGNGFTLLRMWRGVEFAEALQLLTPLVASMPAPARTWRTERQIEATSSSSEKRQRESVWAKGQPITEADLVGRYLLRRCGFIPDTKELRAIMAEDGAIMVARFRSDLSATLHLTYISAAGERLCRKYVPGPKPGGGAVRLMMPDGRKILGIGEGIETSLSASVLFGVPCWSALDAGGLSKWQIPADVNEVLFFADNDQNTVGQESANTLRRRCEVEGKRVTVHIPEKVGTDWNDVYQLKETASGQKSC